MSLEIELKFLNADHAALRRRLAELGAEAHGSHFEANTVFDDAEGSLKARGLLLRLRQAAGRFLLTAKTPLHAPGIAKTYAEDETEVADGQAMADILAALGYRPSLRYEKVRETWTCMGCEVCLDTLPFGCFAEIEGDEKGILACATALGLSLDDSSRDTYHELNRRWREANGLQPDASFVFDVAVRPALDRG